MGHTHTTGGHHKQCNLSEGHLVIHNQTSLKSSLLLDPVIPLSENCAEKSCQKNMHKFVHHCNVYHIEKLETLRSNNREMFQFCQMHAMKYNH